jgi:protein AbiQ
VALSDIEGRLSPLCHWRKDNMDKLNFYTVDVNYVQYLQKAEQGKRGFSRVPNMAYSEKYKQKFLCGIVLQINDVDYYVSVTSYKQQKPNNFLITADNGQIVSSLRFNYMFPIPKGLLAVRIIDDEPDRSYRALLAQELRCCIKNQSVIQNLAERTYKQVLLGKDLGLVANSCDFSLLEQKCLVYNTSIEKTF